MKRQILAQMLISKPQNEGEVIREIRLAFLEVPGGAFEVEITGESPLKGYVFTVKQGDLKKARDQGTVVA